MFRFALAGIALVFVFCGSANAAPEADLWERWLAHDPASAVTVEHAAWDDFLARYVTTGPEGINRVNYAGVSDADRESLASYIETLAATDPGRLNRASQFAYWVNLYNALTVQVILDHYPVDSIRDIDISPGFFSNGPWGAKLLTINGAGVSLDDIEHRILRPIWQDPRIHYAVNCAALGCPNLTARAFAPANTEALLEAGAQAFINHPRGARVDDRGRLYVSSIYEWFMEDFGGDDAGVIAHLKQYASPDLATQLDGITRISGDEYDWALNDAMTAR